MAVFSASFVGGIVPGAYAQTEPFVVADIRVEGLQRIAPGSVFAALPVSVGDVVDEFAIRSISRNLFYTGNFDDISVGRDGNVLVLTVAERPSISEITIEGNKAIETEALLDGLKGAGLAVGQVFQRSTLEGMQGELRRQYVIQGRYDSSIDTEVIPEPRNRVSIAIEIDEGTVSKIKHINIVGNEVFNDETLLELFELQLGGMFSFFSSADKYSKEKLESDLETLTSYYQDRGYLQFEIESTQVAVSPTKDSVYITANVSEGDLFTVTDVDLSGDLVLPEEDLSRFLLVGPGQIFSQQLVTSTEEYLTRRLGNEGYNFAKVTGIPEVVEGEGEAEVAIKFFIDPGRRTYVRRINFKGNSRTADEVLRDATDGSGTRFRCGDRAVAHSSSATWFLQFCRGGDGRAARLRRPCRHRFLCRGTELWIYWWKPRLLSVCWAYRGPQPSAEQLLGHRTTGWSQFELISMAKCREYQLQQPLLHRRRCESRLQPLL